jgi:hypothetical protein
MLKPAPAREQVKYFFILSLVDPDTKEGKNGTLRSDDLPTKYSTLLLFFYQTLMCRLYLPSGLRRRKAS